MLLEDGEMRTRGWETLKCCSRMSKRELVVTRILKCRYKMAKRELVRILNPRHHLGSISSRFVSPRSLPHITRDHCARLVSSNRERFAYYQHISYFFEIPCMTLYVYTRKILGCLLGFWSLGQNPAGAIIGANFH